MSMIVSVACTVVLGTTVFMCLVLMWLWYFCVCAFSVLFLAVFNVFMFVSRRERQAVMFAENRLAPCMGSTVCEEYAGDDGADAAATWVVLKACVAEWELRLRSVSEVK